MSDAPQYQFPNGDPVPDFEQVQRALGPQFVAIAEAALVRMGESDHPQEITQACALLNGMYLAAHALGKTNRRMLDGYLSAISNMAIARMVALGYQPTLHGFVEPQKASVH